MIKNNGLYKIIRFKNVFASMADQSWYITSKLFTLWVNFLHARNTRKSQEDWTEAFRQGEDTGWVTEKIMRVWMEFDW